MGRGGWGGGVRGWAAPGLWGARGCHGQAQTWPPCPVQEHKQLQLKSLIGKGIVGVDEIIQAVKDWLGPMFAKW